MSSPPISQNCRDSLSSLSSDSDSSMNSTDGREWKKLRKQGAKILGICALVAFAIIAIAALAIGIAAMVNPAGLATVGGALGAFVAAGIALATENSVVVLTLGAVSVGLLALAGVVTLLAKSCGLKDKAS